MADAQQDGRLWLEAYVLRDVDEGAVDPCAESVGGPTSSRTAQQAQGGALGEGGPRVGPRVPPGGALGPQNGAEGFLGGAP